MEVVMVACRALDYDHLHLLRVLASAGTLAVVD